MVKVSPPHRTLFHTLGGKVDFSRMIEQAVPAAFIGLLVVFANFKVMQYQVDDIKQASSKSDSIIQQQQVQIQAQAEKLAGISAQITAFLGQQLQLNAAMDARVTYLERIRSQMKD